MAEPTIAFGAAASFGALTGWVEQSSGSTVASDRASVLGATGNEAVSKLHNAGTQVSTPYKASVTGSAPTIPATLGAIVNSLDLTGISISTTAGDFASMTLTGHNHSDNAHAASPVLRFAAHGITLADGFGAKDFLGGTAGADASVESSTINISAQHVDILAGATGNHLIGQNYNAMIEAETVWSGVPGTASSGWDQVSVETRTTNTGFLQTIVRGTKTLALALV